MDTRKFRVEIKLVYTLINGKTNKKEDHFEILIRLTSLWLEHDYFSKLNPSCMEKILIKIFPYLKTQQILGSNDIDKRIIGYKVLMRGISSKYETLEKLKKVKFNPRSDKSGVDRRNRRIKELEQLPNIVQNLFNVFPKLFAYTPTFCESRETINLDNSYKIKKSIDENLGPYNKFFCSFNIETRVSLHLRYREVVPFLLYIFDPNKFDKMCEKYPYLFNPKDSERWKTLFHY